MPGKRAPAPERFWRHVRKTDGCWEWISATDPQGYGIFQAGGQYTVKAHSWAYREFVGQVPTGLHLDHVCHSNDLSCAGGPTCRHRRCVNPAHLEPVTPAENTRRGRGYGKETHCPQGHPYAGENLKFTTDGRRRCRTCCGKRVVTLQPERVADRHGTLTAYTYGCRCLECKAAQSEYSRAYRSGVRLRAKAGAA